MIFNICAHYGYNESGRLYLSILSCSSAVSAIPYSGEEMYTFTDRGGGALRSGRKIPPAGEPRKTSYMPDHSRSSFVTAGRCFATTGPGRPGFHQVGVEVFGAVTRPWTAR